MNNLKYQVFITEDNGNYVSLDCEDLDMQTTYAVATVADITQKNDNLSKNVKFQATKNNTRALGNLFNLSHYVDPVSPEQLFFQTSFNRKVECVVLEGDVVIIKGYLKWLTATRSGSNGAIEYECLITGNIVNFYSLFTDDMMLSDLDFSEYTHQFSRESIQDSWATQIVKSGSTIPFQLGQGYLYPFINYGDLSSPQVSQENQIHINNFRPAIYVQEYIKKVFQLPVLSGFTYEILGNSDFISDQNSLIIPCDQKVPIITTSGNTLTLKNTGSIPKDTWSSVNGIGSYERNITFPIVTDPVNLVNENTTPIDQDVNIQFQWTRDLNTSIALSFNVTMTNSNAAPLDCYARIMVSNNGADNTYSVAGKAFLGTIPPNGSLTKAAYLDVPNRDYGKTSYFRATMFVTGNGATVDFNNNFTLTITNALLIAPGLTTDYISYNTANGDYVFPQPVTSIKISDFFKSWTQLFNIYTFSKLENPKHIYFQSYPDYYALTAPNLLKTGALDWSDKLVYSNDIKISSFSDISKKYTFDYKTDSDYYNTLYTSTYTLDLPYGSYTETDNPDASSDEKKIDLTFSSTPLVSYDGTGRLNPEIFSIDDAGNRTTLKTNMRIMFYNGLKNCTPFQIGNMVVNSDGTYTFTAFSASGYTGNDIPFYPQVGHIRFNSDPADMTYLRDLNFGFPEQTYFTDDPSLKTIPNSYTIYYHKQISEQNDLNTNLLEVDFLLTNTDINNLDLRVPIFLNTPFGNNYYKVISVEYNNRFEPSTVQLQSIKLQ